jgi:hypothetical protein
MLNSAVSGSLAELTYSEPVDGNRYRHALVTATQPKADTMERAGFTFPETKVEMLKQLSDAWASAFRETGRYFAASEIPNIE